MSAFRTLRQAKYWVLHRVAPRHRYHMIDTRLDPGYYDIDTLMLHGMFSLLRRYVEDEMGGVEKIISFNDDLRNHPDPNEPDGASSGQADMQEEAVRLYEWWMTDRPAMKARERTLLDEIYADGRRRPTFEPVEGSPNLQKMVFPPDEDGVAAKRKEMWDIEDRIDREDQEMLRRLIEIRRSLWT